ncbi:MAG: hypothetical protein CMI02_18065 [Oceanospirillaceae bacterium]|nr:hypothetical protein [Oceanospirillaceae bacterium]MBT13932.1 hypothetical protein [Oceanospirillaceae bacterium]|tara:strand:+ start:18779 stop:19243 length:465 start_codon:yes stop_codon:yes gene_type:complete
MKQYLTSLHALAGIAALLLIISFFSATLVSEIFASQQQWVTVKQCIFYGIWLLIPLMALTGFSGYKLVSPGKNAGQRRKQKRMRLIAANGLFILIPAAVFLKTAAENGYFTSGFYLVQALELLAGAVNISLMILNARDGIRLVRHKARADSHSG